MKIFNTYGAAANVCPLDLFQPQWSLDELGDVFLPDLCSITSQGDR